MVVHSWCKYEYKFCHKPSGNLESLKIGVYKYLTSLIVGVVDWLVFLTG